MKIDFEHIETLESALKSEIEYAILFTGEEGYCLICDDENLFKTEEEAMNYALKTDDYFIKVKDLKMSDKVFSVYDDEEFIYYISEHDSKKIE